LEEALDLSFDRLLMMMTMMSTGHMWACTCLAIPTHSETINLNNNNNNKNHSEI